MFVFVLAVSGSQLATIQIQSDCALISLLLFPIGIHSLFSVPLLWGKMHYVININIYGSVLRDHSRRFSEDIFFIMDWSTMYKAMLFPCAIYSSALKHKFSYTVYHNHWRRQHKYLILGLGNSSKLLFLLNL